MIYGLNFNGTQIPEGVKRKFAARVRVSPRQFATLQGVAQSAEEKELMVIQASRPGRNLHIAERTTAGGVWYGVYVY